MSTTRARFARLVLERGGWPDHLNNHVSLVAWMSGEFSPNIRGARFNPFATTRPMPGATDFNTTHVRNYTSLEQGVQATVETIQLSRYSEVVKNLKAHSAAFYTLVAVDASGTWTHFDQIPEYVEGVRSHWSLHAYALVTED